jgi:putative flippase GtrA
VTTIAPRRPLLTLQLARQALIFVGVGAASTAFSAGLYTGLRTWLAAQVANVIAMLVTAVGSTTAHRRLTFGIRDSRNAVRDHLVGLAFVGLTLGMTAASLAALAAVAPRHSRLDEVIAVVCASAVAAVIRFVVLSVQTRPSHHPSGSGGASTSTRSPGRGKATRTSRALASRQSRSTGSAQSWKARTNVHQWTGTSSPPWTSTWAFTASSGVMWISGHPSPYAPHWTSVASNGPNSAPMRAKPSKYPVSPV